MKRLILTVVFLAFAQLADAQGVFVEAEAFADKGGWSVDQQFMDQMGSLSPVPADGGTYDFVVIGGGIAGLCAAVSAARGGCRVALVNDRPVPGGNNSAEIRVHLGGRTDIELPDNQHFNLGGHLKQPKYDFQAKPQALEESEVFAAGDQAVADGGCLAAQGGIDRKSVV